MARILIVDDTALMRAMLKEVLESGGNEVIAEASNGQEAVNLYRRLKPDLVTMDITMPDMDGISALAKIKKFDPQAKVIMCSSLGFKEIVISSIQAGAKDFMVKPFQRNHLLHAIDRLIKIN